MPTLIGRCGGGGSSAFIGARIERLLSSAVGASLPRDVGFETVAYDTDSMSNVGVDSRKLTAHTAGYYLLMFGIDWEFNATGKRQSVITINGFYSASSGSNVAAVEQMAVTDASSTTILIASCVSYLGVGDFCSSGIIQESGGGLLCGGNSLNFLSAALIGT